jgi:hypothetical protein
MVILLQNETTNFQKFLYCKLNDYYHFFRRVFGVSKLYLLPFASNSHLHTHTHTHIHDMCPLIIFNYNQLSCFLPFNLSFHDDYLLNNNIIIYKYKMKFTKIFFFVNTSHGIYILNYANVYILFISFTIILFDVTSISIDYY